MTQQVLLSRARLVVGVFLLLVAAGGARAADESTGGFTPVPRLVSSVLGRDVPFVYNTLRTTRYGPAWADIQVEPTNLLPCRGGPFALCYYSGPEPESCEVSADGRVANCKCTEIPYGAYFVDINAILNRDVYLQTVRVCGHDGSRCQNTNAAPVCNNVNRNTLIPGAELISAFSFDCAPEEGVGLTSCSKALYAGCMTAPCRRTGVAGNVECSCPTFDGPYQVGQSNAQCQLGSDLVWSAAYNPPQMPPRTSAPASTMALAASGSCIPDAPGSSGCPLLTAAVPPPPSGAKCAEVCQEYRSCQSGGVESGFTCDATLCTASCADRGVVTLACSGLQQCDITAIALLEKEVGCSCCASQICGCEASASTSEALVVLNQLQRDRGIVPQCDINGTLCGASSP